jgi:sec-independent protein translocase protein TatC
MMISMPEDEESDKGKVEPKDDEELDDGIEVVDVKIEPPKKKRMKGRTRFGKGGDEKEERDDPAMGFMEHLRQLKKHVVRIVIVVGFTAFFSFTFGIHWYNLFNFWIPYPFPTLEHNISSMVFNKLRADLLPANVTLIMGKPIDAMLVNFQISLFLGVSVGMVVIVRELGRFISPALKKRERGAVVRYSIPSLALFIAGCLFSYFFITPFTLEFLYSFGFNMGIEPLLLVDEFISFILIMILGMGVVFELPVIMAMVTKSGVVDHRFWKKHWRIATVVMIIIAGVITPDTTGITQIIVMVPMIALYGIGYLVSKRIDSKRRRR